MKIKFLILIILLSIKPIYSQSDFDKVLKGGEVLVNGLSFFKSGKSENKSANSKIIESVCVKNKLNDKITFRISGKDDEDNDVKKEMVVQKDGKECVFEVPKGIYTYEIVLSNKEIYKKGEYKFNEEITITVKEEKKRSWLRQDRFFSYTLFRKKILLYLSITFNLKLLCHQHPKKDTQKTLQTQIY